MKAKMTQFTKAPIMVIHVLSCLVKHGSQSSASSIPVCGQTECCFAPCPSQRLLLQSEHPKPLEAFAATPLSLPQRPEHTVQTSEMHSQTPESYHDCFSSNNLHFLSSGLVRGDNRQSPLVLQGKNHCKVAPQVTVHHVWKQGSCFVCTDCTEVFVACEHSLDSHSQNIVQLLHRFEAPSIILVWAVCAARPDRTDNALHHRHSNTYIRYTPDQ